MLVVGCLALLLPGYTAAQEGTKTSAATCGVDIDGEKADALETACLREFGRLASREGDLLTLRLENGASKVYRDDPKACETDDVKNCINHRLAAYHAEARVYSIVIQYYEGSSVELLSARTGKVLLVSGAPYFSPDGSRFIVIDNDYGHGGPHDLSIGSNANSSLSLEWQHLSEGVASFANGASSVGSTMTISLCACTLPTSIESARTTIAMRCSCVSATAGRSAGCRQSNNSGRSPGEA